jgi:hypothetical protein
MRTPTRSAPDIRVSARDVPIQWAGGRGPSPAHVVQM